MLSLTLLVLAVFLSTATNSWLLIQFSWQWQRGSETCFIFLNWFFFWTLALRLLEMRKWATVNRSSSACILRVQLQPLDRTAPGVWSETGQVSTEAGPHSVQILFWVEHTITLTFYGQVTKGTEFNAFQSCWDSLQVFQMWKLFKTQMPWTITRGVPQQCLCFWVSDTVADLIKQIPLAW